MMVQLNTTPSLLQRRRCQSGHTFNSTTESSGGYNNYSDGDDTPHSSNHQVNFNNNVTVNERNSNSAANLSHQQAMDAYERKPHVKLISPPPQQQQEYYDQQQQPDDMAQLASLTQQLAVDEKRQSDENNHHWLVYKQDPTPQYILDAKKRLGQIKDPSQVPRKRSPLVPQYQNKPGSPSTQQIPSSLSSSDMAGNERQWMQWPSPPTPENIKQIRARLGDDRYRKLSDRLQRCKTAQVRTSYEDYQQARAGGASAGSRPKTAVLQQAPASTTVTQTVVIEDPYTIPTAYQVNDNLTDNVVQPDQVIVDNNILPVSYDAAPTTYVDQACASHQVTTVQDGPESGQEPIESWVQKATNEDREAIYRILNSLERRTPANGDYSTTAYRTNRVPSATSWSRRVDNSGSRASNNMGNQYYRLKSAGSAAQVANQSLKKRSGSASVVRKLDTMRNKNNNNSYRHGEGFLINDLLCTQLNGPETVHYGYNV